MKQLSGYGESVLLGAGKEMQEMIVKNASKPFSMGNHLGIHQKLLPLLLSALLGGLSCFALPAFGAETNKAPDPPAWLTQPMSLGDALGIALMRNSSILQGQSDLAAAHGVAVQTRAVALPRVRALGNYTHNEAIEVSPFSIINPPEDEWSGNIRIEQTIYEGGRLRSAVRASRLIREQALHQYQAVVADVLLEVRTAYFNVLEAEQQIAVREASVNLLSQELTNTLRRFDAGAVPRFDVLRGEVELANAQPRLIQARNAYRISKSGLAVLLGYNVPPEIGEDIPLNLTDKLGALPFSIDLPAALAQALQRRPEVTVLKLEEKLRKESVLAAKANYKPSIAAFAGYGGRNTAYRDDFFRDVSGVMAGVEMRWNIFDGLATRGRVQEARAYEEKARFELEDALRRIEQQVRTAYSSFLEAREVLESQKKVQERAEEALRLAVTRYEAGSGTQLDVLNAQTALTEARTTQVEALRNYQVAVARVGRAIGSDSPQTVSKDSGK